MPHFNLQARVTEEIFNLFHETLKESDARTKNEFVEMLLESFLNPKTKTVQVPTPTEQQKEEIQIKDNEIGRLETNVSLKEDEIKELQEDQNLKAGIIQEKDELIGNLNQKIDTLKHEIGNLNHGIENLKKGSLEKPEGLILEENQVIVTLPPLAAAVLDIERAFAEKKSKQPVSRETLLFDTFWIGITKGESYPYKVWGNSDLRKIQGQLENAAE